MVWSYLWVLHMVCSSVCFCSVECSVICDPARANQCRYFGRRIPLLPAQSTDKHVKISLVQMEISLSYKGLWRKGFHRHTVAVAVFMTHTGNHSFYLTKILGLQLVCFLLFCPQWRWKTAVFCARPLHIYLDTY